MIDRTACKRKYVSLLRRCVRRRFVAFCASVIVVLAFFPAASAHSQPSHIPPVRQSLLSTIDDDVFSALASTYFKRRDQTRLKAAYATYRTGLDELCDATSQAIHDPGLEEMVRLQRELDPMQYPPGGVLPRQPDKRQALMDESERNRNDPRWERVYELEAAYFAKLLKAQSTCDQLYETFLSDLAVAYDFSEQDRQSMTRFLRRKVFSHGPPSQYRDFSIGVDVLRVVDDASSDEDPFGVLMLHQHPDPADDQTFIEISSLLYAYEIELDQWIRQRMVELRRPPTQFGAIYDDQPELQRQFFEDAGRDWYRRFAISDHTVESILVVLRDAGRREAARALRRRFLARLCPDLAQQRFCHQLRDWCASLPTPDPELLVTAEAIQAEFSDRYDHLVDQAVRQGIATKRSCYLVTGVRPPQVSYARLLYQMHQLSRSTILRFQASLDIDERALLWDSLHDDRSGRARTALLGPFIDGEALREISQSTPLDTPVFAMRGAAP